jgi:hypothetical protein
MTDPDTVSREDYQHVLRAIHELAGEGVISLDTAALFVNHYRSWRKG